MNVQELYQQKLTTAEEAVKIVKSGDWVDYGWCCNQPVALDKALAARKDELFDVKIHGGVTMWMPEVCKADDAGDHFTWNSWHCSGIDRKIIGKGMGFFGPMRYSELPRFYRPPQGKYSEENLRQAQALGYRTIFWSLAYVDWKQESQPSHEAAFGKLIPRIHPGAVVLLHSTSKTNAEILDELLTKWEEEGYRFATVEELFAS